MKKDQIKVGNTYADIISDARIAGLIDWEHVTDSTRFLRSVAIPARIFTERK